MDTLIYAYIYLYHIHTYIHTYTHMNLHTYTHMHIRRCTFTQHEFPWNLAPKDTVAPLPAAAPARSHGGPLCRKIIANNLQSLSPSIVSVHPSSKHLACIFAEVLRLKRLDHAHNACMHARMHSNLNRLSSSFSDLGLLFSAASHGLGFRRGRFGPIRAHLL